MTISGITPKLIKKVATFKSPYNPRIRMENSRYYTSSPLNPTIETTKIFDNKNIYAEYNRKKLENGYIFESYKLPDEILKVLKNRFGEIKGLKSSIKQHNSAPEQTYEKVKNAMQSNIHNVIA